MPGMSSVALWYMRYHSPGYELFDDEAEAARAAVYMGADGHAAPAGVQFADGRVIACEDWPAYREAARDMQEAERRQYEHQVAAQPVPERKIRTPFGGRELNVAADEPGWLGRQG
jgi:hypothetical protein